MPTRVVLGQVSSERQQAVQFEISGTQLSRRIDTGSSVQVGDLLVQLDDREARARKMQFEANHANLKAQQRFYKKKLHRAQQNHRKGVIADAELEAQQLRFDQLGSELLHARAEITIADIYIEKHRLRAPFNGVLLGSTTRAGERVEAGATAAVLVDVQHLSVKTHLVPKEIILLRKAKLFLAVGLGAKRGLRVLRVAPGASTATGMVAVELEWPEHNTIPGQSVRLGVYSNPADVLVER